MLKNKEQGINDKQPKSLPCPSLWRTGRKLRRQAATAIACIFHTGFDFQFGFVSPEVRRGRENALTPLGSNPFGQSKHRWGLAGEGDSQKSCGCEKMAVTQGRKRFYSLYEMGTLRMPRMKESRL